MKLSDISKKSIVKEGKMAELDLDLKDKKMSDAEFKKKYKKTKAEVKKEMKPKKKVNETTGDEKFDSMMGKITGSDTPQAMPRQGTGQVDRKILELTHKIFLRLREFDDPEVYQKFINFMIQTINSDIGPVDEERNPRPAPKSVLNMENALASVKQSLVNASINVEPYDNPEFRLSQIDEAIRKLNYIRNLLMTDVTIGNARK